MLQMVTLDSAGLNSEPAYGVDGADHKTICKYAQDTAPTYIQVVDYLESVSRKLQLSIEANLKRDQEAASGDNGLLVRGGDARGGSAQGASPRGGDARGGGVSMGGGGGGISVDRGIVRGGDATGGNAAGSDAHGGNANGGDVQFY